MLGVIIGASLVFAREPQLTKVWSKTYDTQVGGYDAAVPDWNNPAAVKSQAGMRNAIGVGGKLYGVDMRTMSVTEFDSERHIASLRSPDVQSPTPHSTTAAP